MLGALDTNPIVSPLGTQPFPSPRAGWHQDRALLIVVSPLGSPDNTSWESS